ncbi:multisubunit Na+/H+ antiporter MnhF subunit [Parabacteroides sp. PFB2-10]|uniref:O-antigen ligase domain-containing protein n=1 Tax=Parabacteroides sp. PFB2-10 TaxID=1742405 RepID=UPI002473960C|nr:O-antigen ligase domain-containing protein [Parabacteroides sp. PFB2-10]MDH6313524.1 multisubunit Na+/H+ antiporter MnhF subunit [Parabacteroides sp. PFB2-10]
MIQEFVNKNFFLLLLFTLIFGVMFYDTIGFNFTDEICALLLLVLYFYHVFNTKDWEFNKFFLVVLGIFLFYLFYSFIVGNNVKSAIVMDFIIQIKPYLGFFCVYSMMPQLDKKQKKIIQQFAVIFSIYLFCIGIIGIAFPNIYVAVLGHPSRFATAISILALLYLYCSDYTKRDIFCFLLILSIGLFSGRSKFYGFFAACTFITLYVNDSFQMKLNLKNTFFLLIGLAAVLFVAKDKIYFYFIQGGFGYERETADLYARVALYYFSIPIIMDYFPFGPGFATYATYSSGEYYSPIYSKYGMEGMHGLTQSDPSFIADTYYPALAQFGIVGIILFFSFWIHLLKKAIQAFLEGHKKESIIALLIIIFFLIESTTDATITHNRGVFMMMLLGLIFADIKHKKINAAYSSNS